MVIWIIGLSGAGKTTIGREVWRQWRERADNVVMLDGDEVRGVIGRDAHGDPHSIEGRRRNAERMTALCELLDRQGVHVVCCILSIFPEMRASNRTRFRDYLEVYVATPLETCVARDDKGIYGPAVRGETHNVVGIDIPFEAPAEADLVLENHFEDSHPATLAARVVAELESRERTAADLAQLDGAVRACATLR